MVDGGNFKRVYRGVNRRNFEWGCKAFRECLRLESVIFDMYEKSVQLNLII